MKIPIKISIFVIAILLVILIQMAITSNNARADENENALAAAVEQTLKQLTSKGYAIDNYEELISDFNQRLLLQINSDSDIHVDVLAADLEKGILDIRVTEAYKTVKGNKREHVCRKTVFLETCTDNVQREYRTIRFQVGDSIFSQYTLYDGSRLVEPGVPELEGRVFRYWKLEKSEEPADLGNMTADGDMTFRAVFD